MKKNIFILFIEKNKNHLKIKIIFNKKSFFIKISNFLEIE
jgi:hypothetical protein